jgi:hypothetical protein
MQNYSCNKKIEAKILNKLKNIKWIRTISSNTILYLRQGME